MQKRDQSLGPRLARNGAHVLAQLVGQIAVRVGTARMPREGRGVPMHDLSVGCLDLNPREVARLRALELAARKRTELGRGADLDLFRQEALPFRIAHAL